MHFRWQGLKSRNRAKTSLSVALSDIECRSCREDRHCHFSQEGYLRCMDLADLADVLAFKVNADNQREHRGFGR